VIEISRSVNGVPIRLTDERWRHITSRHKELDALKAEVLQCIELPDLVRARRSSELLAIRRLTSAELLGPRIPRGVV
jgi:hypothetical protein